MVKMPLIASVRHSFGTAHDVNSFLPGLMQGSDETLLRSGQASDMNQCDITAGPLKRAKGIRVTHALSEAIDGLMKYYPVGAERQMLASSGGKLYLLDAEGTAECVADNVGAGPVDAIGYQIGSDDYMIGVNGEACFKWNGQALTPLADAPAARAIELHKERVWILPSDNLNCVRCSDDLNPENWNLTLDTGAEILLPTWDGTVCTGLKVAFEDLLVTKEKSIWKIWGSDPTNYQVAPVFTSRGAIANQSLAMCDNVMCFLSSDAVMAYDGVNCAALGGRGIEGYLKRMNANYAHKAVAIYFESAYYLALSIDGASENNLLLRFDFRTGAWSCRVGVRAASLLEFDGALYGCDSGGRVFRFDEGDTILGQPIQSFWRSGVIGTQSPDMMKDLRMLYLSGKGEEGSRLRFTYWVNAQPHTVMIPLSEERLLAAVDHEMAALRASLGEERFAEGRFGEARALFERLSTTRDFEEFLTVPAYEILTASA